MKYTFVLVLIVVSTCLNAQLACYNQFPAMKPQHILDEKLQDISFAFSMRVIESNYVGALVRLRRDSDNSEKDFYCNDIDIVDVDAINSWRNSEKVFVVIWYDQSGLNRNAVQMTQESQPEFIPDNNMPFFRGDGVDDYLVVDTPNGIQDVTNNGDQGTILTLANVTQRSQHSFGVLRGADRWSAHMNWGTNDCFFDPGVCCNGTRSFENSSSVGVFRYYNFIKLTNSVIARLNSIEVMNGVHNQPSCSLTDDFAIGWATGDERSIHATTSFAEFIMYRTNIDVTQYTEIEENAIKFWNL